MIEIIRQRGGSNPLGLPTITAPLFGERQENRIVGNLETFDLLNIPSGAGVVEGFWITCTSYMHRQGVIEVYVDGELTPSIRFDLGALGTQFQDGPSKVFTLHTAAETDASGGSGTVNFKYPIPFGNGIVIKFVNLIALSFNLWANVYYRTGITSPLRLHSAGNLYAFNPIILAGTDPYTLIDAALTPGWLVYHSFCVEGLAGWYEADVNIYIDGALTPQFSGTGTEDYFLSGFNWESGIGSIPWAFANGFAALPPVKAVVGLDWLAWVGGYPFNNHLKMVWNEPPEGTDRTFSYLLLYYL